MDKQKKESILLALVAIPFSWLLILTALILG